MTSGVLAGSAFLFLAPPTHAQLSPGELSVAHASLDSLFGCTSCHALARDRAAMKCVGCHSEISSRIQSGQGYHARVAAPDTPGASCATCHSEHNGRDFDLVRWPDGIQRFDHALTGYRLIGAHLRLECGECHRGEHIPSSERAGIMMSDLDRTFLGLDTTCLSCHADPHGPQMSDDCTSCHTPNTWTELSGFDHSRTRFALTGRHTSVACESCHREGAGGTRFSENVFMDCEGCHADPHAGGFATGCASCHGTADWKARTTTTGFDHLGTPFPLEGAHARVACDGCHSNSRFGAPVAHARCLDCHDDFHVGAFTDRSDAGDCRSCHTVENFLPTTFVADRHGETRYPLLGKHAQVSCEGCHETVVERTDYHPPSGACMDCHSDAHDAQFAGTADAGACESCHVVDGFARSTFSLARHDATGFALTGAHRGVPCFGCHPSRPAEAGPGEAATAIQFRFPDTTCSSCHTDPHRMEAEPGRSLGLAARTCTACHGTNSWISTGGFDHEDTDFALRGAHRTASCEQCHEPARAGNPAIAFTGARPECLACHDDVHMGQFAADLSATTCERCHGLVDWNVLVFDHDRQSAFPLEGAHEAVDCRLCHLPDPQEGSDAVIRYSGTVQECSGCH